LSPALETRHGAVVGAAEALLALTPEDGSGNAERRSDGVVDGALAERVVTLVRDVEKARLYRGKGGETMRAATCRFVECLAMSGQPLDRGPGPATGPKSLRSAILASMEESLRHPSSDVRDAATSALGAFAEAYMCGSSPEKGAERLVATLAATAEGDPNPAARRGAAAALGAMPAALLLASVKARKPTNRDEPEPDVSSTGETTSEQASEPLTVPAWRVAMDALAVCFAVRGGPRGARRGGARVRGEGRGGRRADALRGGDARAPPGRRRRRRRRGGDRRGRDASRVRAVHPGGLLRGQPRRCRVVGP
jgi:hypothetical protein